MHPDNSAKLFVQEKITAKKTYPGRKGAAGTWQRIISNIPKCDLFIDTMCGSGLIGSLVTGCQVIFNDIDKNIIQKITTASDFALFLNEDYRQIIKRYDNGNTGRIFYFDPPYLLNTRSWQKSIYNFDWTNDHHKIFITMMHKVKCPVMISHYPCELYDKAFKKWRKITYKTQTRAGIRDENLYMNFPQPVLLQCPDHIGENFTDRQRIKRKVERQIKKLQNEKPQERAAILTKIIEHFQYITK